MIGHTGLLIYGLSLIIFSILHTTQANWLYLGASSAGGLTTNTLACGLLPGLDHDQLRLCLDNPSAMPAVSLGARLGISECHYQFKYERWNCSSKPTNDSIMDSLIQLGTRETAFVYAITSAGVTHAVTEACTAGNLTDCSCDVSHQGGGGGLGAPEGWTWGGCSDNVGYGAWFAERFVDSAEKRGQGVNGSVKHVRALMNLHNNEVGRKALTSLMKMKCRCHGVSGSCGVKTCWRSVPSFREVGDGLKKKYENSVAISARNERENELQRREKRRRRVPIPDTELVFVQKSPNYCRQDENKGILGTKGRVCKRGTYGPEGCESLCCGRGYNTEEIRYLERCHCRFIWCCEVKCKTCETIEKRYTCK